MNKYPMFSRQYFEQDFPRLQSFTNRVGTPLSVLLTLDEGYRIELREYQICPTGLQIETPSGSFLVPFHNIISIQVVPKNRISKKLPSDM
jgi:hypothetical protein